MSNYAEWSEKKIKQLQSDNTTLRQKLEQAEARVAELEEGLHGIANCAYGYSHPKAQTADEAASWMNCEAMRLLGDPQPDAFVLRKQAEAVEHYREALGMWLKELPGNPCASFVEGIISSAEQANRQAQRLRNQADELEQAND